MITKVVYLGGVEFTEKMKSDLYYRELQSIGIDVVYWDLSNILFKGKLLNSSYSGVKTISNYSQLREELNRINNTSALFITTISYKFNTIKLFYLLKKFQCTTAFFARGKMPSLVRNNRVYLSKILDFKSYYNYVSLLLKVRIALLAKMLGLVKILDIVYYAGEKSLENFFVGYKYDLAKAKIHKLNYFDYDETIRIKNSRNLVNSKYCLFHDEYLPFHPDFEIKNETTVKSELYFKDLNRFFTDIEEKLNIQVVIAAHPKAKNYVGNNPFNHRKLFFSKTAELSKYAEFSMTHASTSVSFPVIYNKPLVFITSDQIIDTNIKYNQWINSFANELGCNPVNVNSYGNFYENIKVNVSLNDLYKQNYLISNTMNDLSSSQVFINSLGVKNV